MLRLSEGRREHNCPALRQSCKMRNNITIWVTQRKAQATSTKTTLSYTSLIHAFMSKYEEVYQRLDKGASNEQDPQVFAKFDF